MTSAENVRRRPARGRLSRVALSGGLGLVSACAVGGSESPPPAGDAAGLAEPVIEKLAEGFGIAEGPVWMGDGYLLFVDVTNSRIHRWTPDEGVTTVLDDTGRANGLAEGPAGRVIVAQRDRRLSALDAGGGLQVLAERFEGKRLNSPNDVAIRSDGSIYFTDPPFGARGPEKELDFNGVFRLRPDGVLEALVRDFTTPNGLHFAPDESLLYVNDSGEGHMRVFDVLEDGTLRDRGVFARMEDTEHHGDPDGMAVALDGTVYSAGPGGVWIFRPDGSLVGRIMMPEEHTTNLAIGPDGLYVTAVSVVEGEYVGSLYRVSQVSSLAREES